MTVRAVMPLALSFDSTEVFPTPIDRLQASTKSSVDHIFELQYADDASLPSHTPGGIQRSLYNLHLAYQRDGLVVNTNKTGPCSIIVHNCYRTPNIPVSLNLGSILMDDCDLTKEIQQRIKFALSAFGRLSHRVFLNHNLTIPAKVAVYNVVCISILLYGCESWTPYRHHIKARESFHISSLQRILGIRW